MPTTSAHAPAHGVPNAASLALLGLGAMGSALGRAALDHGHTLTVWNRSPERAEPLVRVGATLATTAIDAAHAAPLVVLCLRDAAGVREVLGSLDGSLAGRTVVNLTSSTPDEARHIARLVTATGARYLDGAIMVPTPMIGDADALLVFSGDEGALAEHRSTLGSFGGQLTWLGADAGIAAVYDLGMLDLYLTGMAGFLHAAALVEAEGVDVQDFLPFATGITDVLRETLPGLARDVAARSYPGDEDTTGMELAIAQHILETSRARGLGTAVPELVHDLLARAVGDGHGEHGFASIFAQFEAPTSA